MSKSKIGVTLRINKAETYPEVRDSISHDWIKYLEKLGFFPVLLPNGIRDPAEYFDDQGCNSLLLTNGNDVCLRGYNNVWRGLTRDICEARLLEHAIKRGVPVMGVCRGFQFINTYFGGKLTSDLHGHIGCNHIVDIIDEKYQSYLSTNSFETNTYHNMGVLINGLANCLIPWATQGNVIEGILHKKHRIVGVQWHPEREGSCLEVDQKLFAHVFKGTNLGK